MRGNSRTSGEKARKEGGNIFDIRTPTAISILVKNPNAKTNGNIYFYDIGDYLKKDEKLSEIVELSSINGISTQNKWIKIYPDQFNDWLNQRDPNFDSYISIGEKKDKTSISVFENYSGGIKTNRDAWCYNFSKNKLQHNMQSMINFYNRQVKHYLARKEDEHNLSIDDVINLDPTQISWNRSLKNDFARLKLHKFEDSSINIGLYRPYTKSIVYFNRQFNDMVYQIPQLFPTSKVENKVICLTVTGTKGFSVLITNFIPDLHLIGDAQCFPLYLYEKVDQTSGEIFNENCEIIDGYQRRDAITDDALTHFKEQYQGENISKEDIFYYIYGLLHSEEYREKYADNLSKQLPRIPRVKNSADFWAFSQAGRDLADLHLNYESIPMYDGVLFKGGLKIVNDILTGGIGEDFYVEKMKFAQKDDKSKVVYNKHFTIENIPLEAYEYVVNGKPALEWVMERQGIKTDKASGIVNDANDWAIETMNNPRYPMELFLRVITVSLETMKIVNQLPKLAI